MRLLRLHAQNFRNFELVRQSLQGASHFLLGRNGQGKTNFLEAAGLLGALRSFRTSESGALIRQGETRARLFYEVEGADGIACKVDLTLAPKGKTLLVDGERVGRLSDLLGRFPAVVLSSDDNQLLRGSPGARRRLLDLHLASLEPAYYEHLRRYHRALAARNRLLKQGRAEAPGRFTAELQSFEEAMAPEAAALARSRKRECKALEAHFVRAYATFAEAAEAPRLCLAASVDADSPDAFSEAWQSGRERDQRLGSTGKGPHRDDLTFTVLGRSAREYGSEGQQRSFVIALRLAQFARQKEALGQTPLVLADDVLGELDPQRRGRFWSALEGEPQVLATGTSLPALPTEREWRVVEVSNGVFTRGAPSP